MAEYMIQDTTLTAIAAAIREKSGETGQMTPLEMPEKIAAISGGGGDIEIGGLTYVTGTPVTFTLSDWDPDVNGATYTLNCGSYTIGENGLQIGLPPDDSTINTQAVVAAALTIVNTGTGGTGDLIVTISAVNPPEEDLTIALFGLEAAT